MGKVLACYGKSNKAFLNFLFFLVNAHHVELAVPFLPSDILAAVCIPVILVPPFSPILSHSVYPNHVPGEVIP